MPRRSAVSHAMMWVALATLWVLFKRTLETVVTKSQMAAAIDRGAQYISVQTGLSVTYGHAITVVTIGLLTVLALAWGYAFHLKLFGRSIE